jgi:hypothetical protein
MATTLRRRFFVVPQRRGGYLAGTLLKLLTICPGLR